MKENKRNKRDWIPNSEPGISGSLQLIFAFTAAALAVLLLMTVFHVMKSAGVDSGTVRTIGWMTFAWILACVGYSVTANLYIKESRGNARRLVESRSRMNYFAEHDFLTGLVNRQTAMEMLRKIPEKRHYAVLMADIDGFREVNEIYGHAFGDEVLRSIAVGLERFAASEKGCFAARYGNDEFLIVFEGKEIQPEDETIRRIYEIFRAPVQIGLASISSFVSIGIANSDGNSDPSEVIMRADIALSAAKNRNKNTSVLFSDALRDEITRINRVKRELIDAIENDGFYMVYQPKISAQTYEVVGYEALVRIKGETMSPAVFIPIAEENGWLREIGRITVRKVVEQIAAWRDAGEPLRPVSVNFSSIQIRDTGYLDYLKNLLKKYDVPPELLQIEITERILLEHTQETVDLMNRFHEMGIRLLMDDFGTGYASLSYLNYIPLDVIKVDKSLVDTYLQDRKKTLLMRDVIRLGHDLGMEMIIEGVETENQFVKLRELSADVIQGYFFSRPLPADDAVHFHVPAA